MVCYGNALGGDEFQGGFAGVASAVYVNLCQSKLVLPSFQLWLSKLHEHNFDTLQLNYFYSSLFERN